MRADPVVVGLDGSAESLAAAAWAADLARMAGAEVVAVHAVGLLEPIGPGRDRVPAAGRLEELRQRFEDDWCAPLHEAGARFRAELRFGAPAEVVLAAAEELSAGVVVVGSRGQGGAGPSLLGSTSARLARLSPVPVVIVPTGGSPGPR